MVGNVGEWADNGGGMMGNWWEWWGIVGNGGEKVEFIEPPADAEIGERVMVDGFDGEPATENQIIKKKMMNVIFPDLSTNDEGVACYKGVALSTSAGPCTAQNQMANTPVG